MGLMFYYATDTADYGLDFFQSCYRVLKDGNSGAKLKGWFFFKHAGNHDLPFCFANRLASFNAPDTSLFVGSFSAEKVIVFFRTM